MTIVFDFDKTLTYYDTTLGLFTYRLNWPKKIVCFIYYFIASLFVRVKFWSVLELKNKLMAWRFSGYSKLDWLAHVKSYAATIRTNKLYSTVDWKQNDFIVISASFREVVEVLFPDNIVVLGSEISFDQNLPNVSFHCFNHFKLDALKKLGYNKIDYLYTDSKNDLPLAAVAKEVRWVKGDHYYIKPGLYIPITVATIAHEKE